MKMEVVLSAPGCFGNDGAPFKNEEIREWSRVDRLTGMLERARIETGRWRTSNDASAHSYGKVTDLRERNSADGSVTQKAKRQVEIFQSQEPGRSVQVFRASQWSSSRITDGIVKSIRSKQPDPILNGADDILEIDPWKFPELTLSCASEFSIGKIDDNSFPVEDASFKNRNSFDKYLLPKRCNSDDDLSSLIDSTRPSRTSSMSFARDCKSRRSLQIPTSLSVSISSNAELEADSPGKEFYPLTSPAKLGTCVSPDKIEDQRKSSDYDSLRRRNSVVTSLPTHSRSSSTTRPNAITVVNLIHPESIVDNSRNRKSSVVTLRSSPVHSEEPPKSCKLSGTKTNSSGDESGINLPGRAVKKVGFCKTEVHFAADSGKVNIVETDGKPPPTNKFRRRRRNQNQIVSSGNSIGRPIVGGTVDGNRGSIPRKMTNTSEEAGSEHRVTRVNNDDSGAYCVVDLESMKFGTNNDENPKIHMTTVKLGKSDRRSKALQELKIPDELTSPKVVSEVLPRKNKSLDCNVITTDSENNRVLSTVVTTHESTVARVEDNLMKPKKSKVKSYPKSPKPRKKNESKAALSYDTTDSIDRTRDDNNIDDLSGLPVYANVFEGLDDRYPIYQNYRADETKERKISAGNEPPSTGSSSMMRRTSEKKRSKAKSPSKLGKRSPVNSSRFSSLSKISEKSQQNSMKPLKKPSTNSDTIKSDGGSSINIESKTKNPEHEPGFTSKSRRVPMEVVYRTAVFNMKNEKLSKPVKEKDTKTTARSINDLICGSKISRTNNSKRKGSASPQSFMNGAPQTKHWK